MIKVLGSDPRWRGLENNTADDPLRGPVDPVLCSGGHRTVVVESRAREPFRALSRGGVTDWGRAECVSVYSISKKGLRSVARDVSGTSFQGGRGIELQSQCSLVQFPE